MSNITPMMKQYNQMKQKVQGAILLFRLGDFYEMFYDDAKIASSILEITLTAREGGRTGKYPMCGFPYHAAGSYIPKLIKAGKKVAICEQVEDPKKAKGIVKRDIVKVITPGTAVDENLLNADTSNFLASLCVIKNVYGLAIVELSTGDFRVCEIDNEHDLLSEIFRITPSELVIAETLLNDKEFSSKLKNIARCTINPYEDWMFETTSAEQRLRELLGTFTLEGFGISESSPVIGAAGAAVNFLNENLCTALDHITVIKSYSLNDYLIIDPISQRNLELLETIRPDSTGKTLFSILDFTSTSMGARLLKEWITSPLIDVDKINARLNAVEDIMQNPRILDNIEVFLKKIRDIERLISRCGFNQIYPRDVVALKESLKQIPNLKNELKNFESKLLKNFYDGLVELPALVDEIQKAIVDEPPATIKDGGVIKPGYNEELDKIRSVSKDGKSWMAKFQAKEMQRTGIKSLKVRYNKVFGYYIEVTKTNLDMVPDNYIRKQTLSNGERYITAELKEIESQVLNAEEQIKEIETNIFSELRINILAYTNQIQVTGRTCAMLDCIVSFAKAALYFEYAKPVVNNDDKIEIINGRHPVIEAILDKGEFVPNDLMIDTESNQLLIITGPNMAGKSTYIRQAALLVIMAQTGSFIPAESAFIGVADRVFTRVGASDELGKGQSTFMVEMIETANILNNATEHSLIILDEIGRGTSTFDGISIAWAVAEYLSNTPSVRARTLFATHYHELTELENQIEGVVNYNIAVKEWNDQIIFLRKIVQGGTDKSYGIHVARLAGLPRRVINRAMEILAHLENDCIREQQMLSKINADDEAVLSHGEQLMLFAENKPNPAVEKLKKILCDKITPLEALNLLYELKELSNDNE
ncbi:DNA mismatch repair protein MutS [bacterium]|nr:DNA mismatch repair protein MutS [bacterium]